MSILSILHCSSQKIITTEVCDPNCTIIRTGAVFATVVLTDYCIKTEYDQILITGPQRPESEKGIVIVKAIGVKCLIHCLDMLLKYAICQLHANERALFHFNNGNSCGPRRWTGPIGNSIKDVLFSKPSVFFIHPV